MSNSIFLRLALYLIIFNNNYLFSIFSCIDHIVYLNKRVPYGSNECDK